MKAFKVYAIGYQDMLVYRESNCMARKIVIEYIKKSEHKIKWKNVKTFRAYAADFHYSFGNLRKFKKMVIGCETAASML